MSASPASSSSPLWLALNFHPLFYSLVAQKTIKPLSALSIQSFDALRPEHLKLYSSEELYSILNELIKKNHVQIWGFPRSASGCTHDDLVKECYGFITAMSPNSKHYAALPQYNQYNSALARYHDQRLYQYSPDQAPICVPWGSQEAIDGFQTSQRTRSVKAWRDENVHPSQAPTSIIAYLSSQNLKDIKLPSNLPPESLKWTPLYQFPPELSPNRLANYISSLRRIRVSARINEQYIKTIGVSFFLMDKNNSTDKNKHEVAPPYRARMHEKNITFPDEIKSNPQLLKKYYFRARLIGLRPQLITRSGLGPEVLQSVGKYSETSLINTNYQLPDSPLVNEIRDKWEPLPFIAKTSTLTQVSPESSLGLWVFVSHPSKKFDKAFEGTPHDDPNADKFELSPTYDRVTIKPPEQSLENNWRVKVLLTKKKSIPTMDAAKFPLGITNYVYQTSSLQMECAYRDQSQVPIKDNLKIRNWVPPHPFRGCILLELVKIFTVDEMIEFVRSRPFLDPLKQPIKIECPVCHKTTNLSRCSQCKETHYCSTDHQREHWSSHRDQCRQRRLETQREAEKAEKLTTDDDIQIHPSSMITYAKLDDPYTLARCNIPVRGVDCKHADCFDLYVFLTTALKPNNSRTNCPHCTLPLMLTDLRISERMTHALANLPEYVSEVVLAPDGFYHPVKAGITVQSLDSDDDDDGDGDDSDDVKPPTKKPHGNNKNSDAGELVQLPPPQQNSTTRPPIDDDVILLD